MRISGPQPAATAATRAGDDAFFLQARLPCLSVATVCFAAAAGLEGQKLGSPLVGEELTWNYGASYWIGRENELVE